MPRTRTSARSSGSFSAASAQCILKWRFLALAFRVDLLARRVPSVKWNSDSGRLAAGSAATHTSVIGPFGCDVCAGTTASGHSSRATLRMRTRLRSPMDRSMGRGARHRGVPRADARAVRARVDHDHRAVRGRPDAREAAGRSRQGESGRPPTCRLPGMPGRTFKFLSRSTRRSSAQAHPSPTPKRPEVVVRKRTWRIGWEAGI